MALDNLRDFIKAIDKLGELVRVTQPVRARLEVAEIADRCMKSPAAVPPCCSSTCCSTTAPGARSRSPSTCSARCAGCAWRSASTISTSIGGRISELLNLKVPEGLFGKLAMLPKLAEIGKFPPRVKSGRPPCQEVILRGDEVDLEQIPFLTTLARRRRPLHHAPDGHHDRSDARHPERRHVPGAGARAATRSRCTGSATRSAPRTGARWRRRASGCRS